MKAYRVSNWAKHYENNRTRDMKVMQWVPVPNKHDGEGFLTIMAEPDGIVIYGCWHLILQVASKCLRERGTLLRDDGTPLDAKAISLKSGWRNVPDMQRALEFLSSQQVSWLQCFDTEGAAIPQEGAGKPQEGAGNGMEGNGIEGRKEEGIPPRAVVIKMPEEGWGFADVEQASQHPTVGMPAAMLRTYFDTRTATGWVDAAQRPVARTLEGLCADMRSWKVREPSHGKAKGSRTPVQPLVNTWHDPNPDADMRKAF
jgi:hypothetical protein